MFRLYAVRFRVYRDDHCKIYTSSLRIRTNSDMRRLAAQAVKLNPSYPPSCCAVFLSRSSMPRRTGIVGLHKVTYGLMVIGAIPRRPEVSLRRLYFPACAGQGINNHHLRFLGSCVAGLGIFTRDVSCNS